MNAQLQNPIKMSENHPATPSPEARTRRRTRRAAWLRTLLGMLFAPALALLVCMIAQHLNRRVYIPLDPDARLSPRLVETLETFPAPLSVTALMPASHGAFLPAARLMRAMQAASQNFENPVSIAFVDPLRDLTAAFELFNEGAVENSLILKTPHAQTAIPGGELFEGRAFVGDRVVADTLRSLTRGAELPLYWLTGHGEGAVDDYTPAGFSDIARELRRAGYPSFALNLLATPTIPQDAAALVVAAPRRAFAPEELALVTDYLDKGGKLLYLAAKTPLAENEDFLHKWGLELTPFFAAGTRTLNGEELLARGEASHPATKSLAGSATLFASPRVIQPLASMQNRLALLPVVQTDASGWGAPVPDASRPFNAQADLPGPVVFIMSAEQHGDQVHGLGLHNTRIVVAGGAEFISNLFLQRRATANVALCVNLVDWLTGTPVIVSADVRAGHPSALNLNRRGWFTLALFTAGAIPGIPFTLLLIRWWRRN